VGIYVPAWRWPGRLTVELYLCRHFRYLEFEDGQSAVRTDDGFGDGGRAGETWPMKQFLLFVSIAAASLYALLVFTHDPITDGKSERISVPQTKPNHPAPQRLSSWETHGRGASTSQPTVPLPVPQNAAAASDARSVSTALQVEWTKVVMGARMHHQASISLRTIRHYSPGTDLQEVSAIW